MRWLFALLLALPLQAQYVDSSALHGASPPEEQPCMDALRCVIHKDSTLAQKRETATSVYILGAFVVIGSNAIWGWDTDTGGYPDTFVPDKQALHFASSFILLEGAIALHVKPVHAVLITSAAGIAFEYSQGHVNGHDIAADILGSVAGALMAHWLNQVHFR